MCKLLIMSVMQSRVQVETVVAGDGLNYPQKDQTVSVHYTARVGTV